MLPPSARIVEPANLSDMLYLNSSIFLNYYLSFIFSIVGIKNLSHITPNPANM
jgi:hypothetical protein